jgi:ABC-2 type transport system permease protein
VSLRRSLAIARHDLRLLRRDPFPVIVLIGMPLVLMAFMRPAFRAALVDAGYTGVNGAEQVVPGTTVMFAFFLVGNVGFAFFREHGWQTWERLRASEARPLEVMAGKAAVPLFTAAIQLAVLFGLGALIFGLDVRGSVLGLVLVAAALAVCLVALGYALTALCRTIMQVNALSNLGALLFAGLGGALTPLSTLPGWARSVAPAVPSYWAMRGFRSVILDGGGVGTVLLPCAVLLAFAAGFGLVAARRFSFAETKTSWA